MQFRLKNFFWLMVLASLPVKSQNLPAAGPAIHVEFREPEMRGYILEAIPETRQSSSSEANPSNQWIRAHASAAPDLKVEFGARIVLDLLPGTDPAVLIHERPLTVARTVAPTVFILQAPDPMTAVRQAADLSTHPQVKAAVPVKKRPKAKFGGYSAAPNDPFYSEQWYLENRDSTGIKSGIDLNVRAAWARTQGEGVTIAVADDGVDLSHPDLSAQSAPGLHYDFVRNDSSGTASEPWQEHATAVAGLAVASQNNDRGMSGVAPKARLASWVIFGGSIDTASDEQMMEMFQYKSNHVAVQNHSWGYSALQQMSPSLLERIAISNAVTFGRNGLGIVMVRAGGNERELDKNVNDDGYAADPMAITVAAARTDGRAASYSTPGAPILVGAPSGDSGFRNLLTTDRQSSLGFNFDTNTFDGGNYYLDEEGFSGTSGAAPLVAGIAALALSVNPELSYRDVQQLLIQSSRHYDLNDPGITMNGAGFAVSHNLGFGIPDAGMAVTLAEKWKSRPPLESIVIEQEISKDIVDDGLRLHVQGNDLPERLQTIRALPGMGIQADDPTGFLPLESVGYLTNDLAINLSNKAALIERGISFFSEKLERAAKAGASFAVVFNNTGGDELIRMGGTEYAPIPAVVIGQNDGLLLREYIAGHPEATAQLKLHSTTYSFAVTNTMLCEHVGVQIETTHPRRADLRITLVSPQGTRSILQTLNSDSTAGPRDWIYYSTHHFYESSAGTWRVEFTDQDATFTGSALYVALHFRGVSIQDTDRDGLDDRWEQQFFGTLAPGPQDDPDRDGYRNSQEQVLRTNPIQNEIGLRLALAPWDDRLMRLSWPGNGHDDYELITSQSSPFTRDSSKIIRGTFPLTEVLLPYRELPSEFFQLRAIPKGSNDH